jgi:SH3-like domain-containing protein
MKKMFYKICLLSVLSLILLFLLSCTENPSTPISITPTKTKVVIPTKTPIPQISIGTVKVDSINVRSGPDKSFEIIGFINKGGEFYILDDEYDNGNNKWLKIPLAKNAFGWVYGEQYYVNQKWVNVDDVIRTEIINLHGTAIFNTLVGYARGTSNSNSNEQPTLNQNYLLCANTNSYLGQVVTCKIPKAYCSYQPSASGSPTFCNDKPYPNHNFTLVVFGEDWSDYDGKCLLVTGLITSYIGLPQINATNRSQVASCS